MAKYKFLRDYQIPASTDPTVMSTMEVRPKYVKGQIVEGTYVQVQNVSESNYVKLKNSYIIPYGNRGNDILQAENIGYQKPNNPMIIQTQNPLQSSNAEALKKINNASVVGSSLGFALGLGYAFKQGKSFWGYVGFGVAFSLIGVACFRAVSYFQNRKNL